MDEKKKKLNQFGEALYNFFNYLGYEGAKLFQPLVVAVPTLPFLLIKKSPENIGDKVMDIFTKVFAGEGPLTPDERYHMRNVINDKGIGMIYNEFYNAMGENLKRKFFRHTSKYHSNMQKITYQ